MLRVLQSPCPLSPHLVFCPELKYLSLCHVGSAAGIISVGTNGLVKLGTDTKNVISNSSRGRDSVRLESKRLFTTGLFIADVSHMPTGCGS